ncbi:MAG: 16S rRNA (guanine(527)-N(7))-methyltransferase RsmG [Anaerolineae bacterium]|nr:16S rRNA (guanine(527)-N(7))-methyltransferase RsmG [Anaerolineae bacterium]
MTALQSMAAAHGISLAVEQIDQFATYQTLLLEWNEGMNLTAIVDPDAIQVRHFLDSLTCVLATGDLSGKRLIDVGTGAGFPGLPLKILFPDLQLTLVDSVAKKTRFLEQVVAALGIDGVTIVAERAETVGRYADHREQYDWAVARAVAHLRILAEYLLPLVRVGGQILAQKGESAEQESAEANQALRTLGGGPMTVSSIKLTDDGPQHYLAVCSKITPTPQQYPRRVGIPQKRPL